MSTKLYQLAMPVHLQLEADSDAEARLAMARLWWNVMEGLPVGAGAFMKEGPLRDYIIQHMRQG